MVGGGWLGIAPVQNRVHDRLGGHRAELIPTCILLATFLVSACASQPATTLSQTQPAATRTQIRLGPTSSLPPPTATLRPATPVPTQMPIPAVSAADWSRGSLDAPVTLVVYSDFQCSLCAQAATDLEELYFRHPGQVLYVFRPFPLVTINDKSSLAAQAAIAAGRQGDFWRMHSALFDRLDEWRPLSEDEYLDWLIELARELELDREEFEGDLTNERYSREAEEAFRDALRAGIPGTPFIYLNGTPFRLSPTLTNLEASVRLLLLEEKQFDRYPPMTLDLTTSYIAHLQLETGEISIRLFPNSAPLAVNSFVFLAAQGWFDGNPFSEVIPATLVRTGDPTGTGLGGPGYHFPTEPDPSLRFDRPGMVALTSASPDTNGSQFFITLAPLPHLDGTRTIFGRVLRGLELLEGFEARDPLRDLLEPPPARILNVWIEAE